MEPAGPAPALATEVTTLLHHGEVGYSDIERLEVLRSAKHADHYRRYDLIASITGQDVAWVVDKGSVS